MGNMRKKILGEGKDTKLIGFKAPPLLFMAIEQAARDNYESPASFLRRITISTLRAAGYLPPVTVVTNSTAEPTDT